MRARVASRYTGHTEQLELRACHDQDMDTGGFQWAQWLLHISKRRATDVGVGNPCSPTGQQVLGSGYRAATDGVEQG